MMIVKVVGLLLLACLYAYALIWGIRRYSLDDDYDEHNID